jgi:hypothetical protein
MIRNEMNTNDNNEIRHFECIYEVNLNVNVNMRVNRTRNCLSKPREPSNENLTGCLQRCAVLGYERKQKDLLCTTNNKTLWLISRELNFDFHQRKPNIHISIFSNSPVMKLVHFNHIWNVNNSWIPVGDMGEKASETVRRFCPQKRRPSIVSLCTVRWTENAWIKRSQRANFGPISKLSLKTNSQLTHPGDVPWIIMEKLESLNFNDCSSKSFLQNAW